MRIFSLSLHEIYLMPRRRRLRKVVAPPNFKGYKPYGCKHQHPQKVKLLYEEYEAIKLADYDMLNHHEACVLMGVSRPTFARIYKAARIKIAQAFVGSREIITVYGNAYFEKNWFECGHCHSRFNYPKTQKDKKCPLCQTNNITQLT